MATATTLLAPPSLPRHAPKSCSGTSLHLYVHSPIFCAVVWSPAEQERLTLALSSITIPSPSSSSLFPFSSPSQAISRIESALTTAKEKIADLDLFVLRHISFGKGDIKKCKMSPDAFIQMALQLAYYKVGGRACLQFSVIV